MGIFRLQRCSVGVETAFAAFTSARFDTIPTLRDLRVLEAADFEATLTTAPDQTVQGLLQSNPVPFNVVRSDSRLRLSAYLSGLGTVLDSGATYSRDALGDVLAVLAGGSRGDSGSLTSGVPTTTSIPVTTGHGSRFVAGDAVIINNECVRIASVSGDTLTLEMALSAAPAAGVAVYHAEAIYPDQASAAAAQADESLFFRLVHDDDDDGWEFAGVFGGMTFGGLGPGELPVVNLDLQVVDWRRTTLTAITGASYTQGPPQAVDGGNDRFYYQTKGTTTRATIPARTVEFVTEIGFERQRAVDGPETVRAYKRLRSVGRLTVTEPFALGRYTDYETPLDKYALYQILSVRSGGGPLGVAFCLPNGRIRQNPRRVNVDQQSGISWMLEGNLDDSDTATDLGSSPWAIYRF